MHVSRTKSNYYYYYYYYHYYYYYYCIAVVRIGVSPPIPHE